MKRVLDLLLKDYHRKSQGYEILGFFFVHHRKNPSTMPLIIRSKDGLLCFNVPLLLRMAFDRSESFPYGSYRSHPLFRWTGKNSLVVFKMYQSVMSKMPRSSMDCAANMAPNRPLWKFNPPCIQAAYGSRRGASPDSSMLAPKVKAPAAIMTLQS